MRENSIDVLMLMDCTSSMTPWIKEASQNLVKVIEAVKKKSRKDSIVRAAYVGYRDYGDIGDRLHFDIMDYSADLEQVAAKI
jgi:hypothetical protein